MSECERAKKKRTALRGLTTRILNKAESELTKEQPDANALEEILVQINDKDLLLKDLDRIIEDGTEDEGLEAEIVATQEYREKILTWKTRVTRFLQNKKNTSNETTTSSSQEQSTSGTTVTAPTNTVRLPRLSISRFNGDVTNWQKFWAQFESAFHLNTSITKVDKFNYLVSYLDGKAASSISGLTLTESNYDTAVEILKDRFGKKELIISAHVNKVLSLSPVEKASDTTGLRNLYDVCETQIRSLKSTGVELDTYGNLLYPLLIRLLPNEIALEFNRSQTPGEGWNVSQLLEFLKTEIESREHTFLFSKIGSKSNPVDPIKLGNKSLVGTKNNIKQNVRMETLQMKSKLPTATVLSTTVDEQCIFCKSSVHSVDNCTSGTISERKDLIKKQGRCFLCLKRGHVSRYCKSRFYCSKCGRKHHVAICESETVSQEQNSDDTTVSTISNVNYRQNILLQTARADVVGKNKINLRILMDAGSQRTFIREDVSRKLGLPVIGEENLTIYSFGSEMPTRVKRRKVRVSLLSSQNSVIQIEALETPVVSAAFIHVPGDEIREFCSESELQLADYSHGGGDDAITLLIGTDFYWQLVTGKIKKLSENLVAIETVFGWIVHGPVTSMSTITVESEPVSVMKVVTESEFEHNDSTDAVLRSFWEIEHFGIVDSTLNENQLDEQSSAMSNFKENLKFDGTRYQVRLPWREEQTNLPCNLNVAQNRFNGLVGRFKKNHQLFCRYKEVIENYLEQGIAEEVEKKEEWVADNRTYYLPHQAVIREDRATSKLRVVFDASSHERGAPSLNDCLLPGPNLNPNLLGLLLRFRIHPVAFTADIEQAFLQIAIAPEDRDAVRFLWLENDSDLRHEIKTKTLRMTRVLFGVTSSPFLLAATLKSHTEDFRVEFPDAVQMIDDNLYVDDLIGGSESVQSAMQISSDIKHILKESGMNMRKWHSNSVELQNEWNERGMENDRELKSMADKSGIQKVLGLAWKSEQDTFTFDPSNLLEYLTKCRGTKRSVLQASGRIFDPIGFLNPFTIRAKIKFQELWERGLQWDEDLPEDIHKQWLDWCSELPLLSQIKIPRYYFADTANKNVSKIQLHCFTDSSENAYGASLYLRFVTEDGVIETILVSSKSRVAPLKKLSLPRLELLGALTGARYSQIVLENFKLMKNVQLFYWTDSMIVLHWIRGPAKQLKTFVQNRIIEIQEKSEPSAWRHCPGNQNPADLVTRGITVSSLCTSSLWWKGPKWLSLGESNWPENKIIHSTDTVCQNEIRKSYKLVSQNSCVADAQAVHDLFEIGRYSNMHKVLCITAWIKRFVKNIRRNSENCTGPLKAEELSDAENYWIHRVQQQYFANELENLGKNEALSKKSKIMSLNPFLDQRGILRVGGRLHGSNFSYEQSHPILLPGKCQFSELEIRRSHIRMAHSGVAETLTQVRDRFWILKGRQRVKNVINKCSVCKKFRAKPMTQETAPLPPERLKEAAPFEVTGVDFAGPLYVSNSEGVAKSYIALFTCAVTRAMHLELVPNMTTESFMMEFRRFISRRGICRVIYSDNARTFHRADKDLKALWKNLKNETLLEYFGKSSISWRYIVEKASWWGGFYERMVRSVKTCLKKMLGKSSLKYQELETTLTEVEAIINSRPLTFVYADVEEPYPLTPSHFLVGKRITSLPNNMLNCEIPTKKGEITKRYNYRQLLLNRFWTIWRKSYILELRSAHHLDQLKSTGRIVKDSVVLIKDENQPRLLWKMGRIQETHVGRDGMIRSCSIRLANGTIIKRPIQLLCPLEFERPDN